ncbi:abc transporter transmembrane region domain-containing protein, partial [Cystoisospora suis]
MMKVSFSSSPRRIGEVEVIVKGGRRRWSSWISPGRDERRRIRKESLASGGLPLVCLHEGKGARKGIASQAGTTMRSGVCTPVVTVHPPGVCTAQPHSGTLPSLGNLFSPCFFSTGRNVRGNLHVFLPGLPHTSCRESTLPSSPPPRPFKLRSQHLSRITLASSSPHFFSPLIPLGHSLTHRLSSSSLRSSLTSASLTCRSLSSSTSAPSPVSSSSSSSPPPPSPTLCSPPSPPSSSSSPSSSPPSSSSSSSSSSFRVLWVLTEGERVRLFLAFIALLLSSAAQLIIPFYLGKLIDRFSSSSPSSSPFASSSCSSEASSSLSSSNEFLSQSSSLSPPSDSSASSSPPESLHIQPSSLSSASTADFLPPPSPTTITTTPQRSLAEGERREDEEEDQDEKKEKKKRFFSQASQALLEASGSTVQASATACGALILLGVLTSYLRLFLLETSIERVANQLRRKYFARLLAEPTERFSKESSGILLNRLSTEITQSSRIFIDVSFGLKCLFSTTVGLGAASSLAPPSFLLSLLCPIAVSGFLFRLTARKSRRLQAEQSRALSHAVHHASEVLQNRRLVRALNAEMLENRNFERQLAAVYKVARRNAIAVGCRHGLVFACGGGFLLHIIQQAGILISAGTLSLGDISALAIYCLMTGSSLQGCVTAYSDVHRTLGIASNLLHSLSSSPLQSSLSLDKKDKKKESSIEVLKDKEEEIFSLKISGDTGNNGLASQPPAREERRGDLCKSSSSFSPRERNLPDHERIRDSLSSFSADENDGMEAHRDTAVLRSLGREKKGVFSKEKKDMINVSRSSFMEDTASGDSHSIPLEPRGRKDTTEEEREEEEEERRGVDVMLRDVWFSYPDQKTPWSLRGVTLHIPAASRWAIL